jgi:hypothetical protein
VLCHYCIQWARRTAQRTWLSH